MSDPAPTTERGRTTLRNPVPPQGAADARAAGRSLALLLGNVAAILAALCALLHPIELLGQEEPSGVVEGRVVDEVTGEGVAAANVQFLDDGDRQRAAASTDDEGYFAFHRVPAGAFHLRVTRIGYAETITSEGRLDRGEIVTLRVQMSVDAITLAPMEVTSRVHARSPVLEGFHRRLNQGVGGTFITRDDIEERSTARLSDLLRSLPGVRIEHRGGGTRTSDGQIVSMGRSPRGRLGGPCPVQIYVDGVLATRGVSSSPSPNNPGGVPVDQLAHPSVVEGVEVYRGLASVPAEFFNENAYCGVIAIWTRRDGR